MIQTSDFKKEQGFTLIEIIAVLVILGILAAVAVPKYIDMQAEAKKSAAMGQVAEMKSTLNLAYSKQFLADSKPPTVDTVITSAGFTDGVDEKIGTPPDQWTVTISKHNATTIIVDVKERDGDSDYINSGNWTIPN
jgi:prepilin-type N-terminal cleavage/methylation domain-containing protein